MGTQAVSPWGSGWWLPAGRWAPIWFATVLARAKVLLLGGGAGWPREAALSPWSASSVGQRGLQRGVAGSWVPVGWPGSDGVRGGPRAASVLSSCPCSELLRGGESWGLVPSAFPVPDSSSASCFLVRPMRGQARRGPATRRGPTARWKHQAPAFDRGANPACLPSAPRSRARWGRGAGPLGAAGAEAESRGTSRAWHQAEWRQAAVWRGTARLRVDPEAGGCGWV